VCDTGRSPYFFQVEKQVGSDDSTTPGLRDHHGSFWGGSVILSHPSGC
jgi:hypothetical protein